MALGCISYAIETDDGKGDGWKTHKRFRATLVELEPRFNRHCHSIEKEISVRLVEVRVVMQRDGVR